MVEHTREESEQLHEQAFEARALLSSAHARTLLAGAHPRSIRIEDREDGLWYVANAMPPITLGRVNMIGHSLEEQLDEACARYDALVDSARQMLYPPRRLGEVLLTQETLHKLLGVPEGLRIVGIRMDDARRTLVVTVEGGELSWVAEGVEPPVVASQWEYTHVELPPASDEDVTGEGQAAEVLSYGRLDWWPHG